MRQIKKIGLVAVGDSAWQGGIQYITGIINALNRIVSPNEFDIHLFKRGNQHFSDLENFKNVTIHVHLVDEVFPPFSFMNRLGWLVQRKLFGRINPRMENYFLKHKFDFVFPALLSPCGGKLNSGAWIADFQYHHFPNGQNHEINKQAEKTIKRIADKAKKIILSSRFCEGDSYRLFPQTRGKSYVMPFAVYINEAHLDNRYLEAAKKKYDIKSPYLMVANLFGATKNHKTLFEALGILRKRNITITLVCTGNFVNYGQMEFTNEVLQMITDNGIRDQLYILGLIPREHQIALYRMAMAIVQPSVNEGWSTCVEEAKALGKVLLLSDIEVHREQFPKTPLFFRSLDPIDLAKKINQVVSQYAGVQFPDLEMERAALINYDRTTREFGRNLLHIASL